MMIASGRSRRGLPSGVGGFGSFGAWAFDFDPLCAQLEQAIQAAQQACVSGARGAPGAWLPPNLQRQRSRTQTHIRDMGGLSQQRLELRKRELISQATSAGPDMSGPFR